MTNITGSSIVRVRKIIIRALPGTVFGIRLRGNRVMLTRMSNGVEVRCVHVLPNSGIAMRLSPCSLAHKHVACHFGWLRSVAG